MAEIKIDLKKTALVVIDIQKGIASMSRKLEPYSTEQVIGNVVKLADRFRGANATTILVHVTTSDGKDMLRPMVDAAPSWGSGDRPKDWADFADQLKQSASDIVITKRNGAPSMARNWIFNSVEER